MDNILALCFFSGHRVDQVQALIPYSTVDTLPLPAVEQTFGSNTTIQMGQHFQLPYVFSSFKKILTTLNMGLLVGEEYTLQNGIIISNYYVNVADISIRKNPLEETTVYDVVADYNYYANKQSRLENKERIHTFTIHISSTTIENIYSLVYTEIKKLYKIVEDDL